MKGTCACGCLSVTELGAWDVTSVGTFWFKDTTHKQVWLNAGMRWGVNLPKASQLVIPLGLYY